MFWFSPSAIGSIMADVCMELSHGFCIPKVDLCHLSLNFFFFPFVVSVHSHGLSSLR